jgi:hypothetical protein
VSSYIDEHPGLFMFKVLIAGVVATSVATAVMIIEEQHGVKVDRERCAAISERTTSETKFEDDICWININSDMPSITPNWQPEEWLR